MIFHNELPDLPSNIKATLIAEAKDAIANETLVQYCAKRRPYPFDAATLDKHNVVERVFTPVKDRIELDELYGNIFTGQINYTLYVLRNKHPGRVAVTIPATDFARSVAFNFVLYADGADVELDFFKDAKGGNESKNMYDLDLPVTSTFVMPEGSWYCYDATTINRIGNINDLCIMLCIDIPDNTIPFDEFIEQHPNIVSDPYLAKQ